MKWGTIFISFPWLFVLVLSSIVRADQDVSIALGLSLKDYKEGQVPDGWKLRKRLLFRKGVSAEWVMDNEIPAVKLHSKAALTFLEKRVDIDLREYPIVSWRWEVDNILQGNDERTEEGDDHPIRIFFVFEPDTSKQSLWLRFRRFLYLDWVRGHPVGGRFTEYLWSSQFQPGTIINDPGKPKQKLMVIEGGRDRLGQWISYRRNLYEDFMGLYGEEPRRLIFIGILNDTDQTGQEAVSYIADLKFHKEGRF